jgi:hypothetical protein
MLRAVLDTNILVSGILFKKGPQAVLLRLARLGKFEAVLSLDIISELKAVLLRSKFKLTEKDVDGTIRELLKFCKIVVSNKKLDIVKEDPKDNMILEAAVSSRADYIISGDNHLLKLKEFGVVKIIKTTDFFEKLAK